VNPQDPLAALHPLREPGAIGWWPPAPGWWLLALTAIGAFAFITLWLVRRHRARAYRREALAQLAALHARLGRDADRARFATDTNALLKAVALRAYPQRDLAARHGQAWVDFLNSQVRGANGSGQRFDPSLADQLYSPAAAEIDTEALQRAARDWITHHRAAA
jgi:hypothetical protein